MNGSYDPFLVAVSILIAMFASYTALDLANSVTVARGKAWLAWLSAGALAMGTGIWSMHFVGMLAFEVPGMPIAYDIPLVALSVAVAIFASALALFAVSRRTVTLRGLGLAALAMGAAIAGMHYIGMWSMRMPATIQWHRGLVAASILIAISASFVALWLAFRYRLDRSGRAAWIRVGGGVVMGFAIAGMHYTAMAAARFAPWGGTMAIQEQQVVATDGLAIAVTGTTLLILALALAGSAVTRALTRRTAAAKENARLYHAAEAEHRVAEIVESIADGFFAFDSEGRVTYANPAAEELVGAARQELVGRKLVDLYPQLSGTEFDQALRRSLSEGVPVAVDYPSVLRPGAWYNVQVAPTSHGVAAFVRDVTSRKHDEQALRGAKDDAEAASRAKSEFLSRMSHELRTPLNAIIGFGQLLEMEVVTESEAESVDQILAAARHLLGLVDQVLEIARIDPAAAGEESPLWLEPSRTVRAAEVEVAGRDGEKDGDAAPATRTVLYVEDNPANLRLVERIFRPRHDLKLLTAEQGRLGLQLARKHRPDLVLLDLNLPVLSGDQVLLQLQADPATREIPVVIVSGDATPVQVQRMLDLGARAYITKPFEIDHLLRVVEETIQRGMEAGSAPRDPGGT